jgi:hypothetical protein
MKGRALFFRIDAGEEIVEYGPAFSFGNSIQNRSNLLSKFQILPDIDGFVVAYLQGILAL